jgi:hypothetical protein
VSSKEMPVKQGFSRQVITFAASFPVPYRFFFNRRRLGRFASVVLAVTGGSSNMMACSMATA